MKNCNCCKKEISKKPIKKYTYVFCDMCSIKMFDKLSLVESSVKTTMEKVQEDIQP